jgi:membrane associated rhomboid family serine protease
MRSQADWQDPPPGTGGGMQFAMPSMTPVVKRLIVVNVALFLIGVLLNFEQTRGVWEGVVEIGALDPAKWKDWFPLVPVWQLVTYGFLHSIGSPFHVLGNMLFLYFLGTMLEGIIGSRRFLATYASGLLVAGLVTLAVGLFQADPPLTLGASGAVLCVVVATAVLRPDTRVIFMIFPITLKTLALIYIGIDLLGVLSRMQGAGSNVAHGAHLAGAAWGFLIARRGMIWRDPVSDYESWRDERGEKRREEDDERLDRLLAKIHHEGIHSLSAAEKAFLKHASKRR